MKMYYTVSSDSGQLSKFSTLKEAENCAGEYIVNNNGIGTIRITEVTETTVWKYDSSNFDLTLKDYDT